MNKKIHSLAVASVLALGPAMASATMINFHFVSYGETSVDDSTGNLATSGTTVAVDVDESLPRPSFWSFTGLQSLYQLGSTSLGWGDDATPGLGWNMRDSTGHSLWGSFFSLVTAACGGGGWGQLTYTVEGGTGLFAGANGQGKSEAFYADDGEYTEQGSLQISVPEPGMYALLAAAGLAALLTVGRRRKVTPVNTLTA